MKILKPKKDKSYVSPIDRFQADFDKKHPKSASQKAEIEKYRRIILLRDKVLKGEPPPPVIPTVVEGSRF